MNNALQMSSPGTHCSVRARAGGNGAVLCTSLVKRNARSRGNWPGYGSGLRKEWAQNPGHSDHTMGSECHWFNYLTHTHTIIPL